jgi:hypothetical protein
MSDQKFIDPPLEFQGEYTRGGWDNKAKIEALAAEVQKLKQKLNEVIDYVDKQK